MHRRRIEVMIAGAFAFADAAGLFTEDDSYTLMLAIRYAPVVTYGVGEALGVNALGGRRDVAPRSARWLGGDLGC
jgi:hypothetical protein